MEILNDTPVALDSRIAGVRLHRAEAAIGAGRQAVAELLAHNPVDQEAVATVQLEIDSARLIRNSLRQTLERAKLREGYYQPPAITWPR